MSRLISLAGVKWSCLRMNKQAFPQEEFDPYSPSAYAPAATGDEDLEEEEGKMVEEESTEAEPLTPGKAAGHARVIPHTLPPHLFRIRGTGAM